MDFAYQNHSLVDVVYEALKKDIAENNLVPGQKLIFRELNLRYGISETPIKQALNRLVAEGIVEAIPRKGMRVRQMQWVEIVELMECRLMIETYCIEKIVQSFQSDPQFQQQLWDNIQRNKAIFDSSDKVDNHFKSYHLDMGFHRLIMSRSGNQRLINIYNNLGTHAYACYIYGKDQSESIAKAGVKEHEIIYHSLVKGDEAETRLSFEKHIQNASDRIHLMLNKTKSKHI